MKLLLDEGISTNDFEDMLRVPRDLDTFPREEITLEDLVRQYEVCRDELNAAYTEIDYYCSVTGSDNPLHNAPELSED